MRPLLALATSVLLAVTGAGTPARANAGTPAQANASTPAVTGAGTPAQANASTPAQANASTPTVTGAGTPARANAGAPARAGDGYRAAILVIDNATARTMVGVSWRRGCPVSIANLRRVTLTHWGFDRKRHQGELIVHKDVARSVVTIFHTLYSARFPVRKMHRVERFRGNDNVSMAADNTSAFNCRPVTGSARGFSVHSYGKAIDINPLENPYVKGRTVLPPAGRAFTNRARVSPSMIKRGDRVWRAFTARGFRWGGDWRSLKDYQHFELPL